MALLCPPAKLRIDFRWHLACKGEKLLIASKPIQLADALQFERVALIVALLPTPDLIAALRRVLLSTAHNFEYDRVAFEVCVICLIIGHSKLTSVLHDAYGIRVACVLIASPDESVPDGLVLAADVGLVNAHFDKLLRIVSQVGKRSLRTVEEFDQGVTVKGALIGIVGLDINYLNTVVLAQLAAAIVTT